jgi:uncharacterized protein YjbI with pentapeptide repeats
LRLVREEGAILIFDGLDEKLVHLDQTQCRAFLRTLWNALPPFQARPKRPPERSGRRRAAPTVTASNHRPGRLILSCRSHYFKTLSDQNAMLQGEYREGVRASDYRAWVLLPFNEDQIREYLSAVLGPERVDDALTLFARVHNLRELAERPYLLALIADRIRELEARQAPGEVVRGVTLYKLLVDERLRRDDGKHHLRPEDKLALMKEIAAEMWPDGAREWPWRRVLAWLGARLAQDEVLRTRYATNAPELLEEDFRTATFVLRPDDSPESFRFAHTSLQEYFLARHLLQALVDNEPGKWKVPFPSPETLDFLGQLLATSSTRERERALRTLEDLLGAYQPLATDAALRYWLVAIAHGLPAPTPLRIDLHGADLSGLTICGRSLEQPLNLVDINLSDTQLIATRFEYVDLSGADLARAQAERAEFHHVRARDVTVTQSDMTAAVWRHCDADGLKDGESANWHECQWIACDLDPATLPEDYDQRGMLSADSTLGQPVPDGQHSEVTTVFGHGDAVWACGFSPDGRLLVSGSGDHTLKLWEVDTGEVCMTLVNAPNGQTAALDERHNRILAASPDAWRYLGWRYFDPQANRLRILPAEHFGPLPS